MVEVSSSHPPKRQKFSHDDWGNEIHESRNRSLTSRDRYTIAWICALHIELAAARAMLDEVHGDLPRHSNDTNAYTLGSIERHNIVIACLPVAQYGTNNAANVLTHLVPVSSLRARHEREGSRITPILREKFEGHPEYDRPISPDYLFSSMYTHVSQTPGCDECDHSKLVPRSRPKTDDPLIPYGAITSGNQVMRHGTQRDNIARQLDVICFEMEAAGMMDILLCLPIRESATTQTLIRTRNGKDMPQQLRLHTPGCTPKNIDFEQYNQGNTKQSSQERHYIVPFGRNKEFVKRESILLQLLEMIPPSADPDDCQRMAIEGLGGVGKTQIALEAVFRVRDKYPDCSVFWVPGLDATSFENAYSWILIIDNADDAELLFGNSKPASFIKYLPFNRNGSIVFTTRNHQIAVRLDISTRNVFVIGEMTTDESVRMLQRNMNERQVPDVENANELLDFLADLLLAIKQASAYMDNTGISIARYLQYRRSSDKRLIELLSKDFEAWGRYDHNTNAVATTWLISFERISRDNKRAAEYLKFMCFLAEKEIPTSLLGARRQ
ncbi:kinesin light chain [Fusarium beomiforme]|uniref:Kinesin light chain n=1 Tax=Fusarium beomiforme TaxID=44412 RepID=A0A9P5A3P6_9HYPO|nr:kinesin light chain [Fusarium beomiforme]